MGWDEEDEELMCEALGCYGDEVCPSCGYETCHCDDIYESSLHSYNCVCAKCEKEFIITSDCKPLVNFCEDCRYEVVTVCKCCGKKISVIVSSISEENSVKNSTYVCSDCCGIEVIKERFPEFLDSEKPIPEVCPRCYSENCHCVDIEYAKKTQEYGYEKDSFYEDECEKCGSVFFNNIYDDNLVNLCKKCRYETSTNCKECGKEFNITVYYTYDEDMIKESSCVCPECEENKRKLEYEKFCKEYFERTGEEYEETGL